MKTIRAIVIIISTSILLSGCIAVDGYFKGMRNKVLSSVDGEFHKEIEFSIGAAAITLSSIAVSFSDAPEFTDDMLRKISRVQIGVYKNYDWKNFNPNVESLKQLTEDLRDDNYEFIVRSIKRDEMVLVSVKNDDYEIREMFVVVANTDELIMTQIFGNLGELMEIAIREQGLNVEVASN